MPIRWETLLRTIILSGLCIALSACFHHSSNNSKVITISITPWPGYYPLYFAIEKNIPKELGAELRVIETLTLEDFSRANIKDHVDGFSLTGMELVRANSLIDENIHFAVFMDYSNGADVIIAQKNITELSQLAGKTVGYEYATLGHLFLQLAHEQSGISQPTYESVNVDQLQAQERFANGTLDAFVTFPPVSTELLQNPDLHIIYDSSVIPYQIVDFLMLKESRLEKIPVLQDIWYQTLDYIEKNPEEYLQFLAELMNISMEEAKQEVSGLELLNKSHQSRVKATDVLRLMRLACTLYKNDVPDCPQKLSKLLLNDKSLTMVDNIE